MTAPDYRGFAKAVLDAQGDSGFPLDVDGGEIQDAATRFGLLHEKRRTIPCGPGCACAEVCDYGDVVTCLVPDRDMDE